jgi:hypothetical protein
MPSSLSFRILVDDILYLLFAVVCEEIADVEALPVRLAFDECPNFNGFSSDIAVAINRYRFFDESLSMFRVDRHGLKKSCSSKGQEGHCSGSIISLEMTFPALLR